MVARRKHRSLGEMISTVCFYGVGVFFVLEGALARDEGQPALHFLVLWLAGAMCIFGGARFLIADLVRKVRGGSDEK
ncbi:hypothetical protein N9E91_04575 [Alphaproteobacteria bacterium]|jgi:hypothetical protein|nr:hypothetical protein [Alphaproteobacteria bacterium]NCF49108.1 hypothetical protein [Bacteroidota bacterium]